MRTSRRLGAAVELLVGPKWEAWPVDKNGTPSGAEKFVGFCVACVFLAAGMISETIWAVAFSVYVRSNVRPKRRAAHLEGGDTK